MSFNQTVIPIIIPCFNNSRYVKNTLDQLQKINPIYRSWVLILDNASDDKETIDFLNSLTNTQIIRNPVNRGPWIDSNHNPHVLNAMPEYYIVTDPDLQFNENLPSNFIEIMLNIHIGLDACAIGFALDISEPEKMFPTCYSTKGEKQFTIAEWESEFWAKKNIVHLNTVPYELYEAPIDTTFVLRRKNPPNTKEYRMAGNFLAKHIPWYIDNPFYSIFEISQSVKNRISTIGRMIVEYIKNYCIVIQKNNEYIIIENKPTDKNLHFWKNTFISWEPETFDVFDEYLHKDKIFIDIGGWIGTTCLYGSRKSKQVYVVEADPFSLIDLKHNSFLNSRNITVIDNAIYNEDDKELVFGANKNLGSKNMNESTSQLDPNASEGYKVKTIRISTLLSRYSIDVSNISLIKVDIEGGEEYILDDLFDLKKKYNIPMYISFHYSWWKNKDIHRFTWMPLEIRLKIQKDPFCSVLF